MSASIATPRLAAAAAGRRLAALLAGGTGAETLFVLAAPVLASIALGFQRMVPFGMIDPTLYTAYAQNGPELIARYGTDNYYWVRQGFILPARATYLLFGPVGGFLVLRYLLALVAIIPFYLLLRRLRDTPSAVLGTALVLTSPVVLTAWGTDYPASAAMSYLFAGMAALFMPSVSMIGRAAWTSLAGIAFALAVHSQVVAAPLIACAGLAYVATHLRRGPLETLSRLALLGVWAIAVTGVLEILSRVTLGAADIIDPTLRALAFVQTPEVVDLYHSSNWRWALNAPYLLVAPAVLAAWAALRLAPAAQVGRLAQPGDHAAVLPAERGLVLASLLQVAFSGWLQFFGTAPTLEYYFYFEMLWPGVALVMSFVAAQLAAPLRARRALRFAPAVAALAIPLLLTLAVRELRLDVWPTGALLVGALVVAVGVLGRRRSAAGSAGAARSTAARSARVGLGPALTALGAVCVLSAITFALTVAKPTDPTRIEGQALLPFPDYGGVIWTDDTALLDRYAVIGRVHEVVPPAEHPGDHLTTWWPPNQSEATNHAAGQYLWSNHALRPSMPDLPASEAAEIRKRRPSIILMISDTGREFPAAADALRAAGISFDVLRTERLSAGATTVHLQVVRMRYADR